MNRYHQILQDNGRADNNSFIYFLHHENAFNENAFNEDAFWQLYNSLLAVTEKPVSDLVDRRMAKLLQDIHGEILRCFIHHLIGEGELANFPDGHQLEWYMERLAMAVDSYYTGLTVDETACSQIQGLKNPAIDTHGDDT